MKYEEDGAGGGTGGGQRKVKKEKKVQKKKTKSNFSEISAKQREMEDNKQRLLEERMERGMVYGRSKLE